MVVLKIMDSNPTPEIFSNPSVSAAAQRADLEHSADSQALVRVAKAIESVLKDGEVVLEFAATTSPGFPTLLAVTSKRIVMGAGEDRLEEVPLHEVTSVRLIKTPEPSVQLGIYNASTTITGFGELGIARVGHALEWVLRSYVHPQVTVEPKDSPEGLYNTWANARNDDSQPADLARKHWYATISGGQIRNQPLAYTPAPAASHGVDPVAEAPLLAPPAPSAFKEFVKPGQTAKPTVPVDISKPIKPEKAKPAATPVNLAEKVPAKAAKPPVAPTPLAQKAPTVKPATSSKPMIADKPPAAAQVKSKKSFNPKILVGATAAVAVVGLVLGGVWMVNSLTGKQAISSPTSETISQASPSTTATSSAPVQILPAGMSEIAPASLPVDAKTCTKDTSYAETFELEVPTETTVCTAKQSDYALSKVYYLNDPAAIERAWVGTYAMAGLPIEAERQPGHELMAYGMDGDIVYIADIQGEDQALLYEFTASTDEQRMNFLRDFQLIL